MGKIKTNGAQRFDDASDNISFNLSILFILLTRHKNIKNVPKRKRRRRVKRNTGNMHDLSPGGGGGGTRVYFGWVCAARVSKFGPRFRKNLHSK